MGDDRTPTRVVGDPRRRGPHRAPPMPAAQALPGRHRQDGALAGSRRQPLLHRSTVDRRRRMDEHVSIAAEQFSDPIAYHGEGPVWHSSWPGLRFVDMLAGDIVSLDAAGQQVDRMHLGTVAAAFRPRRGGGTVAAVERGFVLIDPDGTVHHLPELWDDASIRMNEGGCDPQGRFYCGSMAYDLAAP